jgi:hypothetical protein
MLQPVRKDMELHSVPATILYSFHQAADFMFVLGKTIKEVQNILLQLVPITMCGVITVNSGCH